MPKIQVEIKKLHPDAVIPEYKNPGDAGFDLHIIQDVTIAPGATAILPTGLAVAVPAGYEMQIRMRSGASLNTPLILPNAPATIDAGYRGELGIIARNVGLKPHTVKKGERIAQGIIAPVMTACFVEVDRLPPSDRGSGGYGSSGRF